MGAASQLAIGTVQFGMSYGVANQNGQVPQNEARAILEQGWQAGTRTLDTAIAYGESENVLGQIGIPDWQVISKIPALKNLETSVGKWVSQSVEASLKRLNVSQLQALLLHHPDDLNGPYGLELYQALLDLKEKKLVKQIGVSIYQPDELSTLCQRFHFDIVQAPYNIIDRRIVSSGWAERLKGLGTELHVRSVFLQGLLLMKNRPAFFESWSDLWASWDQWLLRESLTALEASLNFALSERAISKVIVGVESQSQLEEILKSIRERYPAPPDQLQSSDLDLITPSRWKRN